MTQKGKVLKKEPNDRYRVKLESGEEVLCYLSGKMRLHRIYPAIGDTVEVAVDPFKGNGTNRIVRRA